MGTLQAVGDGAEDALESASRPLMEAKHVAFVQSKDVVAESEL